MTRLLTAFCVLAVSGFSLARGWQVAGFAAAEPELRRAKAGSQAYLAWGDVPGVSAAALADAMQAPGAPANPGERVKELAAILAVRPLSSTDWLALAGLRVAMNAPWDRVTAALTMSYLTGPNEATAMLQRSLFGLIEWEGLPAATQAQTVRDLAGVLEGSVLNGLSMGLLKGAVGSMTPSAKTEVAAMLKSEQVRAAQLKWIGL